MPWIRTDDNEHDSPKVAEISLTAYGLLKFAQGWSCKHLTDGWVSAKVVRARAASDGLDANQVTAELERVALLERVDRDGVAGWSIAAELTALQPTAAQTLKNRAAGARRQRTSRHKRRHGGVTRDRSVTAASVTGVSQRPDPSRPDPDQEQRARCSSDADGSDDQPAGAHQIGLPVYAAVRVVDPRTEPGRRLAIHQGVPVPSPVLEEWANQLHGECVSAGVEAELRDEVIARIIEDLVAWKWDQSPRSRSWLRHAYSEPEGAFKAWRAVWREFVKAVGIAVQIAAAVEVVRGPRLAAVKSA